MRSLKRLADRGLTLVELLVAIAILAVLGGLGLFVAMDVYRGNTLRSERNLVVSVLERARTRALSNVNESKHGVYIATSTNEYVLFQGLSYASRTPAYDENTAASPSISRTGVSEVVFEQLTGNPSATGTLILNDGIGSTTVAVLEEGRINW